MPEIFIHLAHFLVENHDFFVSAAALAVLVASVTWAIRASLREQRYRVCHQAISRWDEILSIYNEFPELLNADLPRVNAAERSSFDAINYRTWSLVDYITSNKLAKDNQFRTIIYWISLHNKDWLEENPFMFSSKQFWKVLDGISDEPLTLYRSEPLPVLNQTTLPPNRNQYEPKPDKYEEEIDWDFVAKHYDDKVLNPFANEMVESGLKGDKKIRNRLFAHLADSIDSQDLKRMRIADYGCGPGNILQFLKGRVDTVTGVDISQSALNIAVRRAQEVGINFIRVEKDIRAYQPDPKFDLILSVNSILPPPRLNIGYAQTNQEGRSQVLEILKAIREGLSVNGVFLAILPSFDTTERLLGYWEEHYRNISRNKSNLKNQKYVDKCIKAICIKKKVNTTFKSFADDNIHSQCFHTPEKIEEEFRLVGLQISKFEKVYYPWEMARRFDYGYFPGKEEIWDWFVVATRGEKGASHTVDPRREAEAVAARWLQQHPQRSRWLR